MQPQHLERLRKMINSSTLLTPREKGEWLSLLIVMNDKQVSELETILNSPQEKPANVPVAPMTPLTHISNLPAGIAQAARQSQVPTPPPIARYPLPTPPKPNFLKQWETKLRRTVEEKELSRPREEKLLSAHVAQPPKPAPQQPQQPQQRPQASPPQRTPAPQPRPQPVEPPARIAEPKDIANLTLGNMRAAGSDLAATLKQMVAGSSYFEVLAFLEKSPLYQTYIATGHEALKSGDRPFPAVAGGKNLLTKAEFEAFSDLLKSIQIS